MRTTVFCLLLVFSTHLSNAQDAYDRYTNFYSVEGTFAGSFAGVGLMPTFSIYRGGHKVDAGLSIKFYDVWKDGPGILGTYLSYKFYPNFRKNQFSLYFGYHNLFTAHDKGKKYPVIVDEASDIEYYPDKVLLMENLVGIGFEYDMGNKFYMFNDYSVGAVLDWGTFFDSKTQFEVRSSGMIRLGLDYTVGSQKAR